MEDETQHDTNSNANTALINTFCEITSSSTAEALFFLESHQWDLDLAVSTFLDNAAASHPITAPSPALSPDYSPSHSPSRSRSPSPAPSRPPYELRSRRRADKKKKKKASGSSSRTTRGTDGGIRTLADLNRTPPDDATDSHSDDDDDEDDYEPREVYTGGEKSGMMVQDPRKSNDVDAIFDQAKHSAVERPSDFLRPSSSSRSFTGTARLLSGETVPSAPQQPEAVNHTIIFWRNGFTIDDGPLRRMDDPANASFLESIKKSECPKELEPADRKTPVDVSLVRRDENYRELEGHKIQFQGVGRTLGSGSSAAPVVSTAIVTAASPHATAPLPSLGLVVDTSSPTTSIQLRLADGTRMVSRFNFHHTIRDLRAFIDASRPGGQRNYQLQIMGFPPKQLTDLDQTIEQAGIASSVVIQKF